MGFWRGLGSGWREMVIGGVNKIALSLLVA